MCIRDSEEAWLYHLVRKDNRHNYSVYHYLIYQIYDQASSASLALAMFIPQWTVVLSAGLLLHHDLFLALPVQTWAFVTFNKVMTAQYQLWYMSLLPFLAINNGIVHRACWKSPFLYLTQLAYMQAWLYYAVKLEWFGDNTFTEMQWCNYAYFALNVLSITMILREHRMTITFEMAGQYQVQNV